ncbi:unnamed protein product [Arctogadus glacialis]
MAACKALGGMETGTFSPGQASTGPLIYSNRQRQPIAVLLQGSGVNAVRESDFARVLEPNTLSLGDCREPICSVHSTPPLPSSRHWLPHSPVESYKAAVHVLVYSLFINTLPSQHPLLGLQMVETGFLEVTSCVCYQVCGYKDHQADEAVLSSAKSQAS